MSPSMGLYRVPEGSQGFFGPPGLVQTEALAPHGSASSSACTAGRHKCFRLRQPRGPCKVPRDPLNGPQGWPKQKRLRRTAAQAAALAQLGGASASACANAGALLKYPGVL